MWFSFWRSRNRFSLDELRFLTEQLRKVEFVNEVNKDSVVEALRSIAEILTYGDQHDSSYFEFFMEKQVMGEFVRILKVSRVVAVSVQLLQTMSIMIQNLKNEHAIYYLFSNEYINFLITYSFDFRHEELLSYYISFLRFGYSILFNKFPCHMSWQVFLMDEVSFHRAISGKLNKNTISLLVKTNNDEVISFPLYAEAIKFAFHEESMIRTAVRALTLNVYHVGDESVNKYVTENPHGGYFLNLISFFHKQCVALIGLVSDTKRKSNSDSTKTLLGAIDEIEDNLYYFSDVIAAGIPDVWRIITDSILQNLILPLILPSLHAGSEMFIDSITSLYLLCCILRIVKIKDLANTTAAALFCPKEYFVSRPESKCNACNEKQQLENSISKKARDICLRSSEKGVNGASMDNLSDSMSISSSSSCMTLRETLLVYITNGDDVQALGSLFVLATFLQTKELEESMLDAFGILPQRKQHKKLLLKALVGEGSDEEKLFSSDDVSQKDGMYGELGTYLGKLKDYGLFSSIPVVGISPSLFRLQVIDALVCLLCRVSISAETLWDGGWLLRQLQPYSEEEFNSHHHELLKGSLNRCRKSLRQEIRGIWPDFLFPVLLDEWRKCRRVIEDPSPWKEPKTILLRVNRTSSEDAGIGESSFTAGERMCDLVKVFVLLNQVQMFSVGKSLPEQPLNSLDAAQKSRAATAGLNSSGPKPGTELKLANAVPCRIAFERGKERHFSFLALSVGISGWVVLADELPLRREYGVVRVAAPLAGCNPRIDEKHPRWLHIRIRPSSLPFLDPSKRGLYGKLKSKGLVDGRWTLAFRDEETCRRASLMILEELDRQSSEVERRLKPILDTEIALDHSNSSEDSASSSM